MMTAAFLLALGLFAKADTAKDIKCPSKNEVVAINIGFNYTTVANYLAAHQNKTITEGLDGAEGDLDLYNKITEPLCGHRFSIKDSSHEAIDHDTFLKFIKDRTKDAKAVHLNYSGHGVITSDGEWALLLPNGANCKTRSVKFDEAKALIEKRKLSQKLYRGYYGESFVAEAKGLEKVDATKAVHVTDSPKNRAVVQEAVDSLQTIEVIDDIGECKKSLVKASELQAAIGDKNIYGIFDSCYSGALTGYSNFSVLTPVQWDEGASESDDLINGKLCRQIKQNLKLRNCKETKDSVGLGELIEGFSNKSQADEVSFVEAQGRVVDKIKFTDRGSGNHPQHTKNAGTACFDFGKSFDKTPCPYPTPLSLHTELPRIKPYKTVAKVLADCALVKNESLEVTAYFLEVKEKLVKVSGTKSHCEGWIPESLLLSDKKASSTSTPTSTPTSSSTKVIGE